MKEKLELAIVLATEAHAGQTYNGMPYILHPMRVMMAVDTIEEKIVAILHDVVEDTNVGIREIHLEFGDVIGDAVGAMTKMKGSDETYRQYLDRVKSNEIAKKVKLADMADNGDAVNLAGLSIAKRLRLQAKYTRGRHYILTGEWHESESLNKVIKEGYRR